MSCDRAKLVLVAILALGCTTVVPQKSPNTRSAEDKVIFTRLDIADYASRWERLSDNTSAAWHISDFFCRAVMVNPGDFFLVMASNPRVFDSWVSQLQMNSFYIRAGDCLDRRCLRASLLSFIETVETFTDLDMKKYRPMVERLAASLRAIRFDESP
jgi:hypothetical protein